MDETTGPEIDGEDACLCDEGEICSACAPIGLETELRLQLTLVWARGSSGRREPVDAYEFLAATSLNN